ncbi:MAG: PEGA domain-containing protein, partial [Myxococcota bacterium]|nr:PEGA domain-containing protein [Myxococcota bacterium]
MATDDKGSDLDVFEGLSKKASSGSSSTVPPPPPPPGGGGHHTLLGMTSPAPVSAPAPRAPTSAPASSGPLDGSRPTPPPPGRGSLPPFTPDVHGQAAVKSAVDVDWDDEDEATKIFDKGDDPPSRLRSAPIPAAGAPPPASNMKATLLGLTPPPSGGYPSSVGRFTPPPPPPGSAFARTSGIPSAPGTLPPPGMGTLPPPAPTLHGLGGSMTQSRSLPPPPMGMHGIGSTIPPGQAGMGSDYPLRSSMRSTEETALLHPAQNRASLWILLGLGAALVAGAVLLLLPHTGRAVINVTDPRGSAVGRVDIYIDGRKQCDTAPCIVDQLSSGTHEVKVLADGFEAPAMQAITIESRKDSMATFALGGSAKGTGIKVSGTQAGVKLYVDDKEIGPLPQDYRDVTPGDHVVKIVGSERYQPLERRVTIEKDHMEDLGSVTLKVLKGKATISLSTPGARVFLVAGADRRELPMLPISVDIDTGKTWSLLATRPGYGDYNQPIGFDDGQAEKTYNVTLEPRGGQPVAGAWTPMPPANGGVMAPPAQYQ